ncbi:Pkr1-domain-containing protein [Cryphonectria parasitica EP155]|uniref:Pkr1-domain-containing protein n=1 Tax=Cryphonectria parasitica (strain ATCC 38755 / EP155) TaxID=660469 RepID=A0A9P5CS30_CRYP1|nr:Pkr1-domain-containing protein [Cryphonectria parasitica EP155]KAF3769189.1 Pkr1-domain-containing protein [Cryphonectria parasitica EP155]
MSQFFQDLWESIFTPGPTPSLLIATNATFAALQLVLGALLLATYSIHFVILSFLCAALWWAINWFARELQASHDQELKEKASAARKTAARARTIQTSESETEVETFPDKATTQGQPAVAASQEVEVRASPAVGELKQRIPPASQGSKSSASTEDEWEKVSEYESEKTK